MNFNFIFLIFVSFLVVSCGVKAPPLKHDGYIIDSYIKEYTGEANESDTQSKSLKK